MKDSQQMPVAPEGSADGTGSVDETPETTKILARLMEEDGEIDEYNSPRVWVTHSRKMERDRKMMMDRSMGNAQSVFELGEKLADLQRERDNRERAYLEALACAQDTMESSASSFDLDEWHCRVEDLIGTAYPRNICPPNEKLSD